MGSINFLPKGPESHLALGERQVLGLAAASARREAPPVLVRGNEEPQEQEVREPGERRPEGEGAAVKSLVVAGHGHWEGCSLRKRVLAGWA